MTESNIWNLSARIAGGLTLGASETFMPSTYADSLDNNSIADYSLRGRHALTGVVTGYQYGNATLYQQDRTVATIDIGADHDVMS